MKSIFRFRNPQLESRRIGPSTSGRHVRTTIYRSDKLLVILALTFCLGVVSGVLATSYIPKALFIRPVSTIRVMKSFPVGSSVLPKNTPQAREQFERFGWWREPAVVVGYDTITYKEEVITVCQIRTQRGEGDVLTVNPSWLERF